jgi:LmbE family N-acetylglucosaminyl deacetylase
VPAVRFKGLAVDRAMVIYAHPDDAEFGMAGTVAKWARAGVEMTYVLVTNGASGSQDPKMSRKRLAALRKAEQDAAAKILGVKRVIYLGYEDGYLYPTVEVRRDVTRAVRKYRPDVIITMDPTFRYGFGYVNHPDHIAAAEVALRTVNPDASTRQMFPELWVKERLEPHKPKAIMLATFTESADTRVDISATMELKLKALRAHASQFGGDFESFVRDFGRRIGKRAGYRYAESYTFLKLDVTPADRT